MDFTGLDENLLINYCTATLGMEFSKRDPLTDDAAKKFADYINLHIFEIIASDESYFNRQKILHHLTKNLPTPQEILQITKRAWPNDEWAIKYSQEIYMTQLFFSFTSIAFWCLKYLPEEEKYPGYYFDQITVNFECEMRHHLFPGGELPSYPE